MTESAGTFIVEPSELKVAVAAILIATWVVEIGLDMPFHVMVTNVTNSPVKVLKQEKLVDLME